ncbi:MAG: tripartite tricarboxylate transporter substrate binding protein [Burkholderiales bacterium]|nr:tripartite tricarboxylate transporter substrate binding protein [Burkholderiales bacterium]
MNRYRRAFGAVFALALAQALPAPASAQAYPTRPIRLVVPFAPGGGADISARKVAEALSRRLGQPVVVDNRAGAGGTVGAAFVAQAEPDGYTLLWATPGQQMTNPHLMKSMPYDPVNGFAAVAQTTLGGSVLVVHKDVPARTVAELIALAKAKPGSISFASAGVGASSHLAGELFKSEAGIDIVHVPYKGSGNAVIDVAGGRVQMAIDSLSVYQGQITNGSVRALAVSSAERNPALPDLPPIADTLPGFEGSPVNYITAPAKTPRPIIDRLNKEINALLADPDIKAHFQKSGTIARGSTPEQMEAIIRSESAKWKKVIEQSGAKAE